MVLINVPAISSSRWKKYQGAERMDGNNTKQMTVGNITFTPYRPKPFDVWLKEQAEKEKEEGGQNEIRRNT